LDLQFRPARPEDADAAVPLIRSSGPAAFDYVFTHATRVSAARYLHRAFQMGKGEFGYRNHIVGEIDGQVVAAGAAYSGKDIPRFTLTALWHIPAVYGLLDGTRVIVRGLKIEKLVKPPTGTLHYVAHLGVDPEFRSRGIGIQLVERLLAMGREKGRTTAALDVSVENPRAQALYERIGFHVTQELTSTLTNPTATVPDHRRMEITID